MEEYRHLYSEKEWNRMQKKLAVNPNAKAWIYIIEDPANKDLACYIGKTEDLKERLRCHRKDNGKSYRFNFIKSLKEIKLIVLDEIPLIQWAEAERFYISYFRSIGMTLCNLTDGGDANPNPGYLTDEQKEYLRKINTGKKASLETKRKMSDGKRGENNSFFGKRHSESSKIKQSIAKIGKPIFSAEERQRRAEALSGENNPKYNNTIDNNFIIVYCLAGKSASEIAKETNLSYQFIRRRIKMLRKKGAITNA